MPNLIPICRARSEAIANKKLHGRGLKTVVRIAPKFSTSVHICDGISFIDLTSKCNFRYKNHVNVTFINGEL